MYSDQGYPLITAGGFSHSDISGSTPACGSPKLIAANHVLHRLLAPRHPPCALSSLTINNDSFADSSACRVEAKVPNKKPWLPLCNCHSGVSLGAMIHFALPFLDDPRGSSWRLQDTLSRLVQLFNCQSAVPARETTRPSLRFGSRNRGAHGIRTHDPRLAKPMLSQLS